MTKEMFIDAHDELRAEYAEAHGIDESKIPDAVDSKLADKAYTRMSDRMADMIDRYRDKAKYGEI